MRKTAVPVRIVLAHFQDSDMDMTFTAPAEHLVYTPGVTEPEVQIRDVELVPGHADTSSSSFLHLLAPPPRSHRHFVPHSHPVCRALSSRRLYPEGD